MLPMRQVSGPLPDLHCSGTFDGCDRQHKRKQAGDGMQMRKTRSTRRWDAGWLHHAEAHGAAPANRRWLVACSCSPLACLVKPAGV